MRIYKKGELNQVSETEQAVLDWLTSIGVSFSIVGLGKRRRDEWECDEWSIDLTHKDKPETQNFSYYTGIGHRVLDASTADRIRHDYKGTRRLQSALEAAAKPHLSHPVGLLYSCLMEMSACEQSFSSWCEEYGYDTDSRKAFATYEACQENTDKLYYILSREEVEQLSELLQDY